MVTIQWLALVLASAQGRIAVMPTQVEGSAVGKVPELFDDYLLTAVQQASQSEVIGQNDIDAMLGLERQKELLGCEDDMVCIAEIGGALGVDLLVVMRVAQIGSDWVLTSKVINIRDVRVETRSSDMVSGDVKALLKAVPQIVGRLFGHDGVDGALPSSPSESAAFQPPTARETMTDPTIGATSRTWGLILTIAGLTGVAVSLAVGSSIASTQPKAYEVAWDEEGYQGIWTGEACVEVPSDVPVSEVRDGTVSGETLDDSKCAIWSKGGTVALAALVGGSLALVGYGSGLYLDGRAQRHAGDPDAVGRHEIRWLGWTSAALAVGSVLLAGLVLENDAVAYIGGVGGALGAAWVFGSSMWTDDAYTHTSAGTMTPIASLLPLRHPSGRLGLGWGMTLRF
jgi:hypothetical protein